MSAMQARLAHAIAGLLEEVSDAQAAHLVRGLSRALATYGDDAEAIAFAESVASAAREGVAAVNAQAAIDRARQRERPRG
jgi:hypothetical protein